MNSRDLTIKFTAYPHYLASGQWAREHMTAPLLLCVAPDIAQEQRIQCVAQATLAKTQIAGGMLWTTTAPLLIAHAEGPLAAIWLSQYARTDTTGGAGHGQRQLPFAERLAP